MPKVSSPLIAAMIGDPAGIGPEVCVEAISNDALRNICDTFLIGDIEAVRLAASTCGIHLPVVPIEVPQQARNAQSLCVMDPGGMHRASYSMGQPSSAAGRAVVEWIRLGQSLGQAGTIDGLVLGPIDSTSLQLGGIVKDIDDLQPPDTYMLRLNGPLRVVPITEHIRVREIAATVKKSAILKLILQLDAQLKRWGMGSPRIAVAGLNPHAMYEEDVNEIAPAVAEAQALGVDASGPISPDSVFRLNLEGRYDAVVTMYHDQGQIAVKTTAFAGACTIYMGLPYVMLNVPHGSAFDIAGRGIAQCDSMLAGLRTAAALANGSAFLS